MIGVLYLVECPMDFIFLCDRCPQRGVLKHMKNDPQVFEAAEEVAYI